VKYIIKTGASITPVQNHKRVPVKVRRITVHNIKSMDHAGFRSPFLENLDGE